MGSPPPGLSSEFHWWEPLVLIYQWVPNSLKESGGNGDHRTPTEGETGDLCLSKRVQSAMKRSQARTFASVVQGAWSPGRALGLRRAPSSSPSSPHALGHHSHAQSSVCPARTHSLTQDAGCTEQMPCRPPAWGRIKTSSFLGPPTPGHLTSFPSGETGTTLGGSQIHSA